MQPAPLPLPRSPGPVFRRTRRGNRPPGARATMPDWNNDRARCFVRPVPPRSGATAPVGRGKTQLVGAIAYGFSLDPPHGEEVARRQVYAACASLAALCASRRMRRSGLGSRVLASPPRRGRTDLALPSHSTGATVNRLVNVLSRLGLLTEDIDYHLIRASMVLIFLCVRLPEVVCV